MPDKTYKVRVSCSNCGKYSTLEIPKETAVKDVRCPNCGITALNLAPLFKKK